MKKSIVGVACAIVASTSFVVQSHAQTASNRNLYFYGASLPRDIVQVIAYAREGDKVEIKGNITMTSDQWVAFAGAVVQAGFPAFQGEPVPVSTGRPR